MIEKSTNGLALIRSNQSNLDWWINSGHSSKLPKESFKLIQKIHENIKGGIKELYHFKRFELFKHMDTYLEKLIKEDPYAHAIDFRVIHNQPENKCLNQGCIIKAAPYNISYHGK